VRPDGRPGSTAWCTLARTPSLSDSITDETGALCLATGLIEGEASPDATEDLTVRWIAFDEALAELRSGELFDCMTQMGIMHIALDRATVA
jgi:hypothetical protein